MEIYYRNNLADGPSDMPDMSGMASGEPDLSGYADLTDNYRAIYHHLRPLLLNDILARRRPGEVAILTRGNADAQRLARWLMAWGDGFVTGMLAAIFVAFKPEWLATWSDQLYLKRPPQ